MKVLGINGSPRKNGNTGRLVSRVFGPLREAGMECELLQLSGLRIQGCRACYRCFARKDNRCQFEDDFNGVLEKMLAADGLVLGSPTYLAGPTPEIKALLDRACLVSTANGGLFKRKAGAAVSAARRAGAVTTFDALNHFLLYSQMIVPGSSYWNVAIGREPGEVEADQEGMRIMDDLGRNMAWLMTRLAG